MGMMEIDGRETSVDDLEDSMKHRSSKDRKSSSSKRERDRESKELEKSRDRRKEDKYERERDRTKDKDRRDRGKDKERDRDNEPSREKEKERRSDKDKEKREKHRDRERGSRDVVDKEREKEKEKGRAVDEDKERRSSRRQRDEGHDRSSNKERRKEEDSDYENVAAKQEVDEDKERRSSRRHRDEGHDRSKERRKDEDSDYENVAAKQEVDEDKERRSSRRHRDEGHDRSSNKERRKEEDSDNENVAAKKEVVVSHDDEDRRQNGVVATGGAGAQSSAAELEQRILKMKEERLKKKSEGASEVLAWVSKSRKVEEIRNAEKERALQLSKIFEEQDKMNDEESDEENNARLDAKELGGMKVLHGLDKVVEGGAVVLTLKDQSLLAGDDVNQEVDVLENVEIGEQKRRDDAYKAAKKKTGIYDDKFNDEPGSERKILQKYDDPAEEEGVTLDATGGFNADAEKKLEELRRRIQGPSSINRMEDLNSSGKLLSDYYTQEEMVQFKKPKKKKSLRKKEKLDLDALEAEAKSSGLGASDLGSRNDKTRQVLKEEKERAEAETRSNAYQAAYAKAEEASKALRPEKTNNNQREDDDAVFDDDEEELRKSLERARRLALRKQEGLAKTFPESIASLATSSANESTVDNPSSVSGEAQENKVVFTEMEEFVWGLQLDEEEQKPGGNDVFMEEDELPKPADEEMKNEDGGWTEVKETKEEEPSVKEEEMEVTPDDTIREIPVGKGLAGVLKLLQERGTLKEDIEWGGRNMDKKKSKLVGIRGEDGKKEINIERTDEYGRILTPKEAFRLLSHKFHGKGPGKMKQEKRMRQYQEELKIKQMKNSDTPSQSVERMRETQAQTRTPYIVLSGHVKPGDMSGNNIHDSFPYQRPPNLTSLNLANNNISGTIPYSAVGIVSLSNLFVANCLRS